VQNNPIFDQAVALRQEGKYREAADLFLELARDTEDLFEKAGLLLNVTQALQAAGRRDLAKNQLAAVRELLFRTADAVLSGADEENRRRLQIGVELEDARISAAQDKLQEAMAKLNGILANHQSELLKASFADIYQAVQRDRAFLLADSGSCEESLPILEELDSTDPHDRWTLFYLGHCYLHARKHVEARQKLEEAIQLGLTPDFEGRAHCALGAVCYELEDYIRAKSELEEGVRTASPRYLRETGIWQWLEYTCIGLGLTAQAEHYGRLARAS
jgi:tetratricopeptide (TPR) repeat protein